MISPTIEDVGKVPLARIIMIMVATWLGLVFAGYHLTIRSLEIELSRWSPNFSTVKVRKVREALIDVLLNFAPTRPLKRATTRY